MKEHTSINDCLVKLAADIPLSNIRWCPHACPIPGRASYSDMKPIDGRGPVKPWGRFSKFNIQAVGCPKACGVTSYSPAIAFQTSHKYNRTFQHYGEHTCNMGEIIYDLVVREKLHRADLWVVIDIERDLSQTRENMGGKILERLLNIR